MGFKDKKRDAKKAAPAKKVIEKTKPTVQSNRMVKTSVKETVVEKAPAVKTPAVKAPVVKQPVVEVPVVKSKTDYYGIGITGNHSEITKFKGTCKLKNKKVGEEIIAMLKVWNAANPVS